MTKVLITCGPTCVPIDDVRVISNRSSGEMGHLLAQKFKRRGAWVTIVEGPTTHVLKTKVNRLVKYFYYEELKERLFDELKNRSYDVVIHAAAVSDFQLKKKFTTKLKSDGGAINLKLVPTQKLIEQIKKIAPKTFLIGFKMESRLPVKSVFQMTDSLFNKAGCDLVVLNAIGQGYQGYILDAKNILVDKVLTKMGIVNNLPRVVEHKLAK